MTYKSFQAFIKKRIAKHLFSLIYIILNCISILGFGLLIGPNNQCNHNLGFWETIMDFTIFSHFIDLTINGEQL